MKQRIQSAGRRAGLLVLSLLLTVCAVWADYPGTNEEFINMVEKAHWDQLNEAQGGRWWTFDNRPTIPILASCGTFFGRPPWGVPAVAGDGYGVAALCIGAYRGWIDEELAYQRIHDLLSFYAHTAPRSSENYYCHFYNHWTGNPCNSIGEDWVELDWTPIDSSWLICGALLAAEYYKGTEVDQLANYIYDTLKYSSYDPWVMEWCEYFIINILGAGARDYPIPSWDAYNVVNSTDHRLTPKKECPLFWLQWPQHFVDFRYIEDAQNRNHFDLARGFMLDHRNKCIQLNTDNPSEYPDYGPNSWFLTATHGSEGNYVGYHPFQYTDSGTVMPIAAPSCMAHTPSEARTAMLHYYNTKGAGAFGCYGFVNAYNTGIADSGTSYTNPTSATMDIGDAVMGIECYRSGMPWKYFMRHERVQIGLSICGFTSTTNIPMNDNFDSGSNPNAWGGIFSMVNGATCSYQAIPEHNEWVKGSAVRMSGNNGSIARITMPEVDQCYKDLLSFWLRGESGGEDFDVGLRDAEGHEFRVSISDYVEGGVVSTNWQRVRIPLKRYAVSGDANTDVRILFLDDFNIRFNATGAILIDDLAFVTDDRDPDPPNYVGAACVDGKVTVRWGYPENETVVGYNIFRKAMPDGSFGVLNTSLVSAVHSYVDRSSERLDDDALMEYTVQSIARNQHYSQFASDFDRLFVSKGDYRHLDWNDGRAPNTFGGGDGIWGAADQTFVKTQTSNGYSNWIRRCSFTAGGSGAWTSLEDESLRPYCAVALQVRGEFGGEDIDFGLKSTDDVEVKVALTDYISSGIITTNWAEAVIPLSHFGDVDLDSIDIAYFASDIGGISVDIDAMRFLPFTTPSAASCFVEAENPSEYNGGGTDDYKRFASGLYTLGNSWGSSVGHYAQYLFDLPEQFNEAVLDVVYACDLEGGRDIQVSVDGNNCGDLQIQQTEGWGDNTNDFSLASINLMPLTAGVHTVELRITSGTTSVNLDYLQLRSAPIWFREAEHCSAQLGSDNPDYKEAASGGQVLGYNWAQNAGDYAIFSNVTIYSELPDALLRIRYAQNTSTGRLLTVILDGQDMGDLPCPPTGGWLELSGESLVSEIPLGVLSAGNHTLTLQAETDGCAINLDWLQICTGKAPLQPPDSDGDGITDQQEELFGTRSDLADSDGDGITDTDELSRLGGGFLTDPLLTDTDSDGMDDRKETLADTDPTDEESFFGLVAVQHVSTEQGLLLRWKGSTNIAYEISYTTNLCDTVTPPTVITDLSSLIYTNGHFEFRDDTAKSGSTRFYRIRTQ